MELNLTTFVLEILNFLILVWLLKRFLYRPVKGIIEQRQQAIQQQLAKAEQQRSEAEALREQYESRLEDWQRERESARTELQVELDHERESQLVALRVQLDAEREKAAVLAERQQHEQCHQLEVQAMEQAARFAASLLEVGASPELQDRLFDHLLSQLESLSEGEYRALQSVPGGQVIQVLSAYPLSETQREQLRQQLGSQLAEAPSGFEFREDRKLIAGLRLTIGHWLLHANLQDELKAFVTLAHE